MNVPTCHHCAEPVLGGEQDPSYQRDPMHFECGARAVLGSLGHLRGKCSCYGGTEEDPPEMSKREAAKAALNYARLINQG